MRGGRGADLGQERLEWAPEQGTGRLNVREGALVPDDTSQVREKLNERNPEDDNGVQVR